MCDCSNITLPIGPQGPQGPQGEPGENGQNGINGASVLHNDFKEYQSSGTLLKTLTSYTIPGGTLDTDDILHIKVRWSAPDKDYLKAYSIYFDGTDIAGYLLNPYNTSSSEIDVYLSRTSGTNGKYYAVNSNYLDITTSPYIWVYGTRDTIKSGINLVTVSDWDTDKDIDVKAQAQFGGTISCVLFQVILYKKV